MDKKNWLLLAAVLIVGVVLIAVSGATRPKAAQNEVIITVDGKEYGRIPLGTEQTVTIRQDDDTVNVVRITENGAYMHSSTCENQNCVEMGEVTLDNWEFRPNGAFVICLPNRVSIELAVKQ